MLAGETRRTPRGVVVAALQEGRGAQQGAKIKKRKEVAREQSPRAPSAPDRRTKGPCGQIPEFSTLGSVTLSPSEECPFQSRVPRTSWRVQGARGRSLGRPPTHTPRGHARDNFSIGSRPALHACRAVARGPGPAHRSNTLVGPFRPGSWASPASPTLHSLIQPPKCAAVLASGVHRACIVPSSR